MANAKPVFYKGIYTATGGGGCIRREYTMLFSQIRYMDGKDFLSAIIMPKAGPAQFLL
jgi:hypothetical protein